MVTVTIQHIPRRTLSLYNLLCLLPTPYTRRCLPKNCRAITAFHCFKSDGFPVGAKNDGTIFVLRNSSQLNENVYDTIGNSGASSSKTEI